MFDFAHGAGTFGFLTVLCIDTREQIIAIEIQMRNGIETVEHTFKIMCIVHIDMHSIFIHYNYWCCCIIFSSYIWKYVPWIVQLWFFFLFFFPFYVVVFFFCIVIKVEREVSVDCSMNDGLNEFLFLKMKREKNARIQNKQILRDWNDYRIHSYVLTDCDCESVLLTTKYKMRGKKQYSCLLKVR